MRVEYVIGYAAAADLAKLALLALNAYPVHRSAWLDSKAVTYETRIESNTWKGWLGKVEHACRAQNRPADRSCPGNTDGPGFCAWNVKSKLKENLPLAAAPEVQFTPSWWPWMPIVPFRISVVTQ